MYETVNIMKCENEYHEIIRRLSKVISKKLRYLGFFGKTIVISIRSIFFGCFLLIPLDW